MAVYHLDPAARRRILLRQAALGLLLLAVLVGGGLAAADDRREAALVTLPLVALGVAAGLGMLLWRQHRLWSSWRFEVSPGGGALRAHGIPAVRFAVEQVRDLRRLPDGSVAIDLAVPPGVVQLPAGVARSDALREELTAWRPVRFDGGARRRTALTLLLTFAGLAAAVITLAFDDPRLVVPLGTATAVAAAAVWIHQRRDPRLDEAARQQLGKLLGLAVLLFLRVGWILLR